MYVCLYKRTDCAQMGIKSNLKPHMQFRISQSAVNKKCLVSLKSQEDHY